MKINIIIIDKKFDRIKYIINNIINRIEKNNIRIFLASTEDEVKRICAIDNVKLVLIHEDLKKIGNMFDKYIVLYYRKYSRKRRYKEKDKFSK